MERLNECKSYAWRDHAAEATAAIIPRNTTYRHDE
jgi:hypothetical protein